MKIFGHPKIDFFISKVSLNFEAYGRQFKITPEAGEKIGPFLRKRCHKAIEIYQKSTFKVIWRDMHPTI